MSATYRGYDRDAYALLARVSVRRLWPMRASGEARRALRQWLRDLREIRYAS